jgi:hypothetical protein
MMSSLLWVHLPSTHLPENSKTRSQTALAVGGGQPLSASVGQLLQSSAHLMIWNFALKMAPEESLLVWRKKQV